VTSTAEQQRLLFIARLQQRIRAERLGAADANAALVHLATVAPLAVDQAVTEAVDVRARRDGARRAQHGRPTGSRRERKKKGHTGGLTP
jgi:hypothetical protein